MELDEKRIPAPVCDLYDDFTFLDREKWNVSTATWGGEGVNNGVRANNISCTDEGILLLKGQGMYSQGLERSGAAIYTRESFGAGSYEAAIKILPRLGVCNAMWTYFAGDNGKVNHEIDIELPGHRTPEGDMIGYDNVLNTNWLNVEGKSTSKGVPLSPQNNGQWHTYRFDWHTKPQRIDYYVDGVLTSSTTENVPTKAGRLWLGVWFPHLWCGTADFEEDYMMIDWLRISPFNEPYEQTESKAKASKKELYPAKKTKMPIPNFVSDRMFSRSDAWKISGEHKVANGVLTLEKGSEARQKISAVYGGFCYNVSVKTSFGKLRIEYVNAEGVALKIEMIDTAKNVEAPLGTREIILVLYGAKDFATFEGVSILRI